LINPGRAVAEANIAEIFIAAWGKSATCQKCKKWVPEGWHSSILK